MTDRRLFVKTALATIAATARPAYSESGRTKPRLGVVVGVSGEDTPDKAIAKVRAFGLQACQVDVGMAPATLAEP